MMKSICMVLLAAVLIAAVAPPSAAVIRCGTVTSYLNPCVPYVTRNGRLGSCCNGVKRLYNAARTTPDKRSVCNCLKSLALSHSSINEGKAAGLPKICGVNIPYKISRSIDCSRVR